MMKAKTTEKLTAMFVMYVMEMHVIKNTKRRLAVKKKMNSVTLLLMKQVSST